MGRSWRRFVGWCGGAHPVGRASAAVLAPTVTLISTLLALGVIEPFNEAEPLADSQAKTFEAGTSRLRVDVDAPRDRILYTATGVYDYREDRGRMAYNLTRMGYPAAAAVETRFFQNAAYMRVEDSDPRTRRWVLVDLERDPERLARSAPATTPELSAVPAVEIRDPTNVLADLNRADDVEDLGTERRLGVELHKYEGTLPAQGGGDKVTATAWIGDDDLVRQLVLTSGGGRSKTTMTFYDYGVAVDVRPPPASTVDLFAERLAGTR